MTDLVVQTTDLAPSTLFGTDNPNEVVERAAKIAKTLEHVVRTQKLVVRIGQSEHVRVEGWTFLGSMLGVFPVVEWTRPVVQDELPVGWEARVEARTRSGEIVGAAEAECLRSERTWAGRDDYALRSMAQTRAVSKALRLPLGFVMQLAGFDPTPADEMPVIDQPARVDMNDPDIPFGDYPHESLMPPASGSVGEQTVEEGAAPSPVPQVAVTAPELAAPTDSPLPPGWKDEAEQKKYLKKLNVLVGQLRPEHITTLDLWTNMGRKPVPHEDGTLRWRDLRDSLTKEDAHKLIDMLERFAADKLAAA